MTGRLLPWAPEAPARWRAGAAGPPPRVAPPTGVVDAPALRSRLSSKRSRSGRNWTIGRRRMKEAPTSSRSLRSRGSVLGDRGPVLPDPRGDQRVAGGGPLPTGGRYGGRA